MYLLTDGRSLLENLKSMGYFLRCFISNHLRRQTWLNSKFPTIYFRMKVSQWFFFIRSNFFIYQWDTYFPGSVFKSRVSAEVDAFLTSLEGSGQTCPHSVRTEDQFSPDICQNEPTSQIPQQPSPEYEDGCFSSPIYIKEDVTFCQGPTNDNLEVPVPESANVGTIPKFQSVESPTCQHSGQMLDLDDVHSKFLLQLLSYSTSVTNSLMEMLHD